MKNYCATICVVLSICLTFADPARAESDNFLVVSARSDSQSLQNHGAALYARVGDLCISGVPQTQLHALRSENASIHIIDRICRECLYYIVTWQPRSLAEPLTLQRGRLVYDSGDFSIIETDTIEAEALVLNGAEIRRIFFDSKPWNLSQHGKSRLVEWRQDVQATLAMITPESLFDAVSALSGEHPVTVGNESTTIVTRHSNETASIEIATQYTYEFFEGLGYEVSYDEFSGPGKRNVIAIKDGIVEPLQYYVFCAHLDDMPPGDIAPGADDNASGSVAVMTAAELLVDWETDYSIIFALWTGEEQGLHGSYNFARNAYNSGMQILGVVNLDMIAWDSTGDPQIELHTYRSGIPESYQLAQLMEIVVDLYDLDLTVQIVAQGTTASDHASFWDFGYPAFLAIEDFGDFNANYHTRQDLVAAFNMPYFTDFTKASVATLLHLAAAEAIPLDGDVDGSGRVDGVDLILLERAFGAGTGESDYNEQADFDLSGLIDQADLDFLTAHFGSSLF